MKMIGQQCPGKNVYRSFSDKLGQPSDEVDSIAVVQKNLCFFYTPPDNMVQNTGRVQSR